jgi:hypothetical protein
VGGTGNYVLGTGATYISDCNYNKVGNFITGFSFDGSETPVGRDRNVKIENCLNFIATNAECAFGSQNNATATTLTAGSYVRLNLGTIAIAKRQKMTVNTTTNNGRATYLPTSPTDLLCFGSINIISSNNNRRVDVCIVKNGNTAIRYGEMSVFIPSSSQPFPCTIVAHIPDASENDFFEVFAGTGTTGSYTAQDSNIVIYEH